VLAEGQRRFGVTIAGLGAFALVAVGCGNGEEQIAGVGNGGGETATHTLEVSTPAPTATAEATYAVQAGDTLYDLALEWGTTVEAIVALNGLADANVLAVGQVLKIPPRSEQ